MRMVVSAPVAKVYGKPLRAGQKFDCPEKEAKLWAALSRAHPVSAQREVEIAEVETDTIVAVGDGEPAPKRRGRPPGSYSRRDMRADED
ncbi:hypothetical protein QIH87_50255 (plasmid) [Bradyrhizobium elkanii]|uniref:hypothetical protein n=1 Tax=Bradyrhizobium elkanii TaxID=29448 RepID=UPI002714BBB9|nr:hypothetical protein [Bradyrhizobium elkanii]WLB14815.1 hypothetical protein QIH87_50255 [Bradyrhizobium elkanii]WLB69094.1 hypothetical protein QIH89_27660 [Bradyrhizobium elkanii]